MGRRFTPLAAIAAMLTTAAQPVEVRIAPPPPDASPVKCRVAAPPPVYAPAPPARPLTREDMRRQAERERREARRDARQKLPSPPPVLAAPPAPAPPPPPPMPVGMAFAPRAMVHGFGAGDGRFAVQPADTARYAGKDVAGIQQVAAAPVSTFSVDVDTGSYANVRRFLNQGQLPPFDAVRTEEMINYFRYDYPRPATRAQPFSVTTDVSRTPWNPQSRLLRIGLRGYDTTASERPAANLVFLVDVSGSMSPPERLPLVKSALAMLADKLTPRDRVSIVVYAGAAGVVLEPTSNKEYVKAALACLNAGGSTAGGAGLKLAYATARAAYIPGGINRILVATDGDFNVGMTNNKSLEDFVKAEREGGITLTTLGFGTSNYNEALMERIADVGNGNYAYIDSAMEARKVLDEQLESTLFTIAKDVKVQVEFNPAQVGEYRLIGYENRALAEEDFANDAVDAGDIGAGHQVTALYEVMPRGSSWLGERRYAAAQPTPAGRGGELAFVKLRYKLPGETQSRLIERPVPGALLRTAQAPSGDMAFVTAVAAFGQRLRGDKYLGAYSFSDVRRLAGQPSGYLRGQFVELVALAEAQTPKPPVQ
jgi:Ca-activated chloride channel family protein